MKLAIICAMDEELSAVKDILNVKPVNEICKAGNIYSEFIIGDKTIIAVVSGIGKVNAAITTQVLLDNFSVDYVINVGVAGSLSSDLNFGDVVIATDLVQHDCDVTAFGLPKGQIPRMDTFSFKADDELNKKIFKNLNLTHNQAVAGRIVSGDQFIDDGVIAQQLHKDFDALACEMEGAAIAHVCYVNSMPFTVVRALSDMAGQDGIAVHSYDELKEMAADRAASVIRGLLI